MQDLYIGLMSGTSADGIDAALVDFSQTHPTIVATHYTAYTPELREKILALCQPGENEIDRLGELDTLLGKTFAHATNTLLAKLSISPSAVKAIGSHGQTIRHVPTGTNRFTLQIADPNIIAAETGITTVADFRRKDLAYGGQGAPLVPGFHQHIFASHEDRAVVNIGGISNVTLLSTNNSEHIVGFDLGPGNVLLDAWIHKHLRKTHDHEGEWGAQGIVQQDLLQLLLEDPFFTLAPPKSTGREHFNLGWLEKNLEKFNKELSAKDVQATLVELTARSIVDTIKTYMSTGEILICGGGTNNKQLMSRLTELALPLPVFSTEKYGVAPDWIEAMAFAWLARQTLNHNPGNLPSVTGATKTAILGGVYYAA